MSFYRSLPAYFGGKRRLCPLIFSTLAEVLPASQWSGRTFLDPCVGGGSVALTAKALGFRVIASDIAERALVVARGLVANSDVRLSEADVLDLFLAAEAADGAGGRAPDLFPPEQARWLEGALARAERRREPVRSLLLLVIVKLVLRSQPLAMIRCTDARRAAEGDLDLVNPHRLSSYIKSTRLFSFEGLAALADEVNLGVFGGEGRADKGDAPAVIRRHQADVLYLDPPYAGTTGYEREYRLLDRLLADAGERFQAPAIDSLLRAAEHIPLVVLSYGGPAFSLDQLVELVGTRRPVLRAVAAPYSHLKAVSRGDAIGKNKEYIIVAGR